MSRFGPLWLVGRSDQRGSELDAQEHGGGPGAFTSARRRIDGGDGTRSVEVVVETLAHGVENVTGCRVGRCTPRREALDVAVDETVVPLPFGPVVVFDQ